MCESADEGLMGGGREEWAASTHGHSAFQPRRFLLGVSCFLDSFASKRRRFFVFCFFLGFSSIGRENGGISLETPRKESGVETEEVFLFSFLLLLLS